MTMEDENKERRSSEGNGNAGGQKITSEKPGYGKD